MGERLEEEGDGHHDERHPSAEVEQPRQRKKRQGEKHDGVRLDVPEEEDHGGERTEGQEGHHLRPVVREEESRRSVRGREKPGAEQHPAREKRVEEALVGLDTEKPEDPREVVRGERFVARQQFFVPPEGTREILHQVPAVAEERHVDAEDEAGRGEEPQRRRQKERSPVAARAGQSVDRRVEPALRARGDEEGDQQGVRRGVDRPEEFEKVKSPGQLRRKERAPRDAAPPGA